MSEAVKAEEDMNYPRTSNAALKTTEDLPSLLNSGGYLETVKLEPDATPKAERVAVNTEKLQVAKTEPGSNADRLPDPTSQQSRKDNRHLAIRKYSVRRLASSFNSVTVLPLNQVILPNRLHRLSI